jgi:hypothetical protein
MQYNAKTVLRLIPNETLARLFAPFPAFADFDWNTGSKGGADRIFERWQTMDDGDVRAVGRVLRQVHCLATPRGTRALIEAGRDQGIDLAEELAALGNAHERALACSIDHPEVFSAARILDHIEGLRRTSWEKRNGFPKQDLGSPETMKAELGPRIGDYYRARDGRGAPCKVEHQKRNNGSHWFFAYPADYEDEVLGYDEAGELGRRPWSKAFEVVFIYDGTAGTIDLYAQGGRGVRDELTSIFTEVAFGEAQESEPWKPAPYNLDLFKKSGVELPTKPEHHITSVRVKALRFEVHGAESGTIAVDTGRSQKPVYQLIRAHLNEHTATLADVSIREVSLQVLFEPPGKRKRTVTFEITPTHCNLDDSEEADILRGYLKEWTIEVAG